MHRDELLKNEAAKMEKRQKCDMDGSGWVAKRRAGFGMNFNSARAK